MIITKTYEYWVNKIELTKTSVTSKKEIIHPNVDVSFLSFLVGLIDGDGCFSTLLTKSDKTNKISIRNRLSIS